MDHENGELEFIFSTFDRDGEECTFDVRCFATFHGPDGGTAGSCLAGPYCDVDLVKITQTGGPDLLIFTGDKIWNQIITEAQEAAFAAL